MKRPYRWAHNQTQRALQIDFFRFVLAGSVGFVLTALALLALHKGLHLHITIATLLSSEVGLLSNFMFHENWTYSRVDHKQKPLRTKLLHFHMSSWSAVALLTIFMSFAVEVLGLHYLVSLVIGTGITLTWNFFWTKYYIFNGKTPPVLTHPEETVPETEKA